MSTLSERPLDTLIDMIYNVTWQNLLEVFNELRHRMDSIGPDAMRDAFAQAKMRFLEGPFADHLEVRWGMNLCPFCNDDNIEKNGISYLKESGDGLEFNQCLNCRIGILYNLVTAKATMDSYVIGLGMPGQFNDFSVYWVAIGPEEMSPFQPVYELVKDGQWKGSFSLNDSFEPSFLPFESMEASIGRGSAEPWTTEIPDDIKACISQFITEARSQVEVALAIR